MSNLTVELEKLEHKVLETEESINENISSGEITSNTLTHFKELQQKLQDVAEAFYVRFSSNLLSQTVTYGASTTTSRICGALKNNLDGAKERGDNPIAAERLIERKYLFYVQTVISGLKSISETNTINRENYVLVNDSVRVLTHLAKNDQLIVSDSNTMLTPSASEAIANVLNKSVGLFADDANDANDQNGSTFT